MKTSGNSTSPDPPARWEHSAGIVPYSYPFGRLKGRFYLLLRYSNGGHWGFPKGGIEQGETPEVTAERELIEETRCGIRTLHFSFRVNIDYHYRDSAQRRYKVVTFFLGRLIDPCSVTLSEEHMGYRWLPYRPALKALSYHNTRSVLRRAEEQLKSENSFD